MLGKVFQILLCFLVAMQPASKSLSTDLYYRLAETGQPMLVTLVDTAAAELAHHAALDLEADPVEASNHTEAESIMAQRGEDSSRPAEGEVGPAANESHEIHKKVEKEFSVHAVATEFQETNIEKELYQTNESEIFNHTQEIELKAESPVATAEEAAKKVEAVPKPSEPQEDIPSFSEWAQKQLEEAEKNKENVVNHSSLTTQGTVTSAVNLKVRSKNYASPDCGAKIMAANPEAGSAGYILSSSKDEYMLNTCNSRIWFIVELCEAVQAKKVDLANFELFSSTPKNFSVSVSDRFPTREWASVGQFIAKDERDVQTFNLHPHLFGKFIRVELHSYYGSEHYCPISLFRVYGTSEFEVFETENLPNPNDDDDDDDTLQGLDENQQGDISRNLFGSARDAVMSIMKKAAQVLVKSGESNNATTLLETVDPESKKCRTPSHIIVCDNCSNSLFTDVYDLMSCDGQYLDALIQAPTIRSTLCNTDICQQYGLDFKSKRTSSFKTEMASYISALLVPSYVAALCNMLAIIEKKVVLNTSYDADLNVTSNLTIDSKNPIVTEENILNGLLQDSLTTCLSDGTQCKDKPEKLADSLDNTPPIKVSITVDVPGGNVADIKPTKTLQNDADAIEPSVITVLVDSDKRDTGTAQVDSNHSGSVKIESSIDESETMKTEQLQVISDSNESGEVIRDTAPEVASSESDKDRTEPQDGIGDGDNLNGSFDAGEENGLKLSTQDQLSLDKLLSELEQAGGDPATPAPPQSTLPTQHQGQKESVFLRLSNRIKALERNMSLSGQYLEELSRRYKKQVEEMQRTFDKTLQVMNEESKKSEEREQRNMEEMLLLQQQLAQLSTAVNVLLAESDSLFGNTILLKVMAFQILLAVIVVFIFKRKTSPDKSDAELIKTGKPKRVQLEKNRMRRKSTEGAVGHSTGVAESEKQRRLSEECLNSVCVIQDGGNVKPEKKKRKRKTSIIHRSYSIPASAGMQMSETGDINIKQEGLWPSAELPGINVDTPVALEEAEFLAPEVEPVDFSRIGEVQIPNTGLITPKKEFPKTNGLIFGMKSSPLSEDKKSGKLRRLSSPAFFRAAMGRQSSKSNTSFSSERSIPPVVEDQLSQGPPERGTPSPSPSPQPSAGSSAGELSQAPLDLTTKNKRTKGRAFKNIFKKVF